MRRDHGALVALGTMGALAALSSAGRRGSRAGGLQHEVRRLPFVVTYDLVRDEEGVDEPEVESGFVDDYRNTIRTDHLHGDALQAELHQHQVHHEVEPADEDDTAEMLDLYDAWEAGLIQIPMVARLVVNLYDVVNNFMPTAFSNEGDVLREIYGDHTDDGWILHTLHPKPDIRRGLGGRKTVVPWPGWVLPYLQLKDDWSTHSYRRDHERRAATEAKIEQIEASMLGITVARLRELRDYEG